MKKKAHALFIKSLKLIDEHVQGRYRSIYRGVGAEFEEFREYQEGDPIQLIDWNVTARMGRPFCKRFREERRQTIFLLIDVSNSTLFGTGNKSKRETIGEIATLIALSASMSLDRVGMILFSNEIEALFPPKGGISYSYKLLQALLAHETRGRGSDLKKPLLAVRGLSRKRTALFLLSDFLDEGYEAVFGVAARYHDLHCIAVNDRFEAKLFVKALFSFWDLEKGSSLFFDSDDHKHRSSFFAAREEREARRKRALLRLGAFYATTSGEKTSLEVMKELLRAKERRKSR